MHLLLSFLLLLQPGDAHQALTPGAVRSDAATYKVAPGRLLTLRVTSVAGKPVKWFAASTDVDLVPWPDGTQAIFCSVKPGVYRLAAWSADKDGNPTEATVITVTVEGASPVVPPAPIDPDPPKPPPGPVTPSKLVMVVVEESEQRSAAQAALYADAELRKLFTDKHRFRVLDKDVKDATGQTPQWAKSYLKRAEGKTLPWVMLVTDEGTPVLRAEFSLPTDPKALMAEIKKAGG